MENSAENIAVIILAAGASKRLGKPKQLLVFRGETLLTRAVKAALSSGCRPVIVVLSANAESVRREIEEFDVEIAENREWKNGMGTSIRIGLEKLLEMQPDISAAVLAVCDQPFVSADLIEQLAVSFRLTNAPIVACSYGDTIGVPTLFSRRLFLELSSLETDGGAKKIIYRHRKSVVEIPFEAGATDIDTERDYLNLIDLTPAQDKK